jgi:FAD/FMN-containing dehydrogenase
MHAWVESLTCVFADGTSAELRREAPLPGIPVLERYAQLEAALLDAERATPSRHAGVRKESSGYGLATWARGRSPIDFIVGSEGTLAIVVGAELRLAPQPAATGTVLAAFPTIDAAAAAAATAAELNAAACELLDRTFLDIARRGSAIPVPDDADAVLLIDLEEPDDARLRQMATALTASARDAGATHTDTALDHAHAEKLWHLRHAASPILAALSRATISMQVIEDGAVPPAKLPEYVRGLRALLAQHDFEGVLFGHAGDGHLHANVLVDVASPDWRQRLTMLFDDTVRLVASLGGTLAGEHGDGRLRAGALSRMWSAATVERFRAVKDAFDPGGILNPGVKLPSVGAPSLGGPVKHDPALEPLPAAARAALDRVQRDRIWHAFRLSLLEAERPR